MSPCGHSYLYSLSWSSGDHPYKSWLCKHRCSLLSGTTGSEGLSQLLRLSGGTSRGCGQHNGFIIEPWKYSLFSTIPLGLCPARNAHPISLASQPSLAIKFPSKCHILQDMFPEIPLMGGIPHPFWVSRPLRTPRMDGVCLSSDIRGGVCPHPEGRHYGLAPAQHRADAAQLAAENTLTRDPHTRAHSRPNSFIP